MQLKKICRTKFETLKEANNTTELVQRPKIYHRRINSLDTKFPKTYYSEFQDSIEVQVIKRDFPSLSYFSILCAMF